MKFVLSFATTTTTTTTAAAALSALLLGVVAPTITVVSAQQQQPHAALLPGAKKVCKMLKGKEKCSSASPPTKKPTAAVVKIPTTKPTTRRPTRFPTAPPTTHRPSTWVPSAGPSAGPSFAPTGSPSGSPTQHPTAECANLRVPVRSHGGHRYARLNHAVYTWDQARAAAGSLRCCGAPGHLLVVGGAAERDFVTATFNVLFEYGWVGFHDEDTEGTYLWTDDTALAASLFVPAPFNGNGDAEDCGLFYNNVNAPGKWYTYSCTGGFGYSYVEFDCSAKAL
jgi:Lectin C-type domain